MNIPRELTLVGQPFRIVSHYPTILVQCQCEAKTPILLVGSKASAPCTACGNLYAIGDVGACSVGVVADPAKRIVS